MMKRDDLITEMANLCDKNGFSVLNIDSQRTIDLLKSLATFKLKDQNFISEYYDKIHTMEVNPRCNILDSDTCSSLLQVTEKQLRPFSGVELCLTIPRICPDHTSYDVSIPIPLFDELVNIADPYVVDWHELCNKEYLAHFRIALRHMLIESKETKELKITKNSLAVGAMISLSLLGALDELITPLTKIPDVDSSLSMQIRGLLSLTLTCMASGATSQLSAWQLFKENTSHKISVPENNEMYDVYVRTLRVAKFAGWNVECAESNLSKITRLFLQNKIF
jgi:hypothetical protein